MIPLCQIFASERVWIEGKDEAYPVTLHNGYSPCIASLFVGYVIRRRRVTICVVRPPNGIKFHGMVNSIATSFISGIQDIVVIMLVLRVAGIS